MSSLVAVAIFLSTATAERRGEGREGERRGKGREGEEEGREGEDRRCLAFVQNFDGELVGDSILYSSHQRGVRL